MVQLPAGAIILRMYAPQIISGICRTMKKIYYLSTCNTCARIMGMIDHLERFELQDLKTKPLNSDELDELYEKPNRSTPATSERN